MPNQTWQSDLPSGTGTMWTVNGQRSNRPARTRRPSERRPMLSAFVRRSGRAALSAHQRLIHEPLPRHAATAEPRSGSIPPPLCRRIDCAHELRIVASPVEVPVDSGLDHCLKGDITEHRCGYLELKPRSVVNPEPGGPTRRMPTHRAPLPGTCRPCRRVLTHRTSPRANCETMFPCFDPM